MEKSKKTTILFSVSLSIVLLGIRFFFLCFYDFQLQAFEHSVQAQNILSGKGYVFPWNWAGRDVWALDFPGFAFLLFILQKVFGAVNGPIWILNCILSFGILIFVFAIAQHLIDQTRVAWIAAFLVAVEPFMALYSSVKIHNATLVVFLTLVWIHQILRVFEEKKLSWKKTIFWGGLGALTLYIRPNPLWTLPLCFAFLWKGKLIARKEIFLKGSVMIGLVFLLILPWLIRNDHRVGRPLLVSNTFDTFWIGNNPHATGGHFSKNGKTVLENSPFAKELLDLSELERGEIFAQDSQNWLKNHPFAFLGLFCKKVYNFWWFSSTSGFLYRPLWNFGYRIFYFLFFGTFLGGILLLRQKKDCVSMNSLNFILCFFVVFSLFQAIFYVEIRHRIPLIPLMAIFSGYFLVKMKDRWMKSSRKVEKTGENLILLG